MLCTHEINSDQSFYIKVLLKLGLSEKHTKFKKKLPHGFDKSADFLSKLQNHEEEFFKSYVLLKKFKLYLNWVSVLNTETEFRS